MFLSRALMSLSCLKESQAPTGSDVVTWLIKPPGGRNSERGEVIQIHSSLHHPPAGCAVSTPLIALAPCVCDTV